MLKIIMFIVGVLPFFIAEAPTLVSIIGGVIVMTIPIIGNIIGTGAWIWALSVQFDKPFSLWTIIVLLLGIFSIISLWYPELSALFSIIKSDNEKETKDTSEPIPAKQQPAVKAAPKTTPVKANSPPPVGSGSKSAVSIFEDSFFSINSYLSNTGLCDNDVISCDLGPVLYLIADLCASVNGHLDRKALWDATTRLILYDEQETTESEYLELCKGFQFRVDFYTQLLNGQEPNMFYWLGEKRPNLPNPLARITAGFCDVLYDGNIVSPEEYYEHPIIAIRDITETVDFTKSVYIELVDRFVDYYNEIFTAKSVEDSVKKVNNESPKEATPQTSSPTKVKAAEPMRKVNSNVISGYCYKCGTKLAQGSSFCHKCGTPVYKVN